MSVRERKLEALGAQSAGEQYGKAGGKRADKEK
jgi:hypothetical protein